MTSDDTTNDGASTHRRWRPRTRRSVLALGAAGLSAGVCGCSAIRGDLPGIGSSDSSVFEEISFEGQHMVLQLREGHQMQRVNLIGPDGTEFTSSKVAAGATTTRLKILEIEPSASTHYPVGTSKLVGVLPDRTVTKQLKLEPSLRIVKAEQYSGKKNRSLGNIELSVRNNGSAPTWVFDIFYKDIPNNAAEKNGDGRGSPGIYLKEPAVPTETILSPREEQSFVDSHPPFLFGEKTACSNTSRESKVFVKAAFGETISRDLSISLSGETLEANPNQFGEEYVCETASVNLLSAENKQ